MSRRAPEGSGMRRGLDELAIATATKGQPGGGRLRSGPAKGTQPNTQQGYVQRNNGNQASGRGPLFNNRGQQQAQQPQPISPEERQGAINARLLAAKAATGQGANLNGTANAQSTGVGRGEATVKGGK